MYVDTENKVIRGRSRQRHCPLQLLDLNLHLLLLLKLGIVYLRTTEGSQSKHWRVDFFFNINIIIDNNNNNNNKYRSMGHDMRWLSCKH